MGGRGPLSAQSRITLFFFQVVKGPEGQPRGKSLFHLRQNSEERFISPLHKPSQGSKLWFWFSLDHSEVAQVQWLWGGLEAPRTDHSRAFFVGYLDALDYFLEGGGMKPSLSSLCKRQSLYKQSTQVLKNMLPGWCVGGRSRMAAVQVLRSGFSRETDQ